MTGKTGSKVISMCIVPVNLNHGDGKDIITTYVMLDNCSQGSLFMITWLRNLEAIA